ncbi:hypothetical protein BDY17DRAFT_293599 [Neohortaea acidophila]|uniref:HECT-type E3 ubiquitin transferase n=1 Tax=Neohortaea acidophila TaxID=245834 RepID=A0A6A6PZI5_9PEZI|nr:uncharacterized protein BDY17DRAFT_293599 [Neohortaea acidophila]KAF2485435.1 hypothetical protein BDY17DRAFT_293599 [Neohortaea acidophila]
MTSTALSSNQTRVTRAAARLQADRSTTSHPPDPSPPAATPSTASRKRKAPSEPSPPSPRDNRKSKKPRASNVDVAVPASPEEPRKQGKKRASAAMSSSGPSSSNSAETSPQSAPRDSSKRKTSRKKSKEEPTASASASSSRRPKKGSKRDQDASMKDANEKPEESYDDPAQSASRLDTGAGAGTGAGADGGDGQPRRFTQDELDAMERSDDPFTSGYFARFGGGPGGPLSSLRALSGIMSGTHGRLRNILEQLRTKEDQSVQLIALQELSELLLVSNEDNLAGHFSPDQYVKELVTLMQPNELTGEENPEIMLVACRCIANMMEALPQATASVVYGGAVPILCQKLLEIQFIDLAEQALSTLEKISVEFPSSIVREGGLTACLGYLDFFATSTQRTAVTTAANCCRNIPEDSFSVVKEVMPTLLNTLSSSDQRVVDQASLCVSRIIDSFKYNESRLESLVKADLLRAILRLLLPGSTNTIGPSIHTQFLRVLAITARASPGLSLELLKMNVVDTLYQILTGVSPPSETEGAVTKIDKNIIMQAIIRTPRDQVYETLNVICELLPTVSNAALTFIDNLYDAGYTGPEHMPMSTRSKSASNATRIELLQQHPNEAKRFAVILFPTLMHAYTSTVNLNVRQKVLTAQLKMLSNFDIDILQDCLRGVAYASHLASILTQQDNPSLVTYALQAAELLLLRLESIYRPQFYREGVMAEISKLAERSVQPDTSPKAAAKLEESVQSAAELELVGQHDDEIAEDEGETIEVDMAAHDPDDDEDEHDEESEENDEDLEPQDEDDEEEDEDGDGDGRGDRDNRSDVSESPSPERPRRIDMQDVITLRARAFMTAHGDVGSVEMRKQASTILEDLQTLGAELKSCYSGVRSEGGIDLFHRLAKHFDGDALESITSYELMSSGIVETLLELFTDADHQAATEARSDFLEVFMTTTNNAGLAAGESQAPATAFSVLIHKLQDLLSRAEHFEVITVHQNAFESNRSSPASMLAKQLRLKLVADEASGIPRPYRNIMVSIHAIATFKALDDYLRPRISMSERSGAMRSREGITSAMAAYAAAMASRGDRSGPPPPQLSNQDIPSPAKTDAKKQSKSKSSKSEDAAQAGGSKPEEPATQLRRSSREHPSQAATPATLPSAEAPTHEAQEQSDSQAAIECADEAPFPDDDDDDDVEADLDAFVDDLEEGGGLDADIADPTAVNVEVGTTGKVTARTEDGVRVGTPSGTTPVATPTTRDRLSASARLTAAREFLSTPTSSRMMSYASALQQTPQDWHIEFSVNDQPIASETTIYRACHFNNTQGEEFVNRSVWSSTHTIKFKRVQGPPPPERTSTHVAAEQSSGKNGDLPPSLDNHPVTSGILRLLSILHDLNSNLDDVLAEHKTTLRLTAEPLTQFVNTKLTAKLNRQLEEPLIVASQCLPTWSEDLSRLYPFLFPFETRHLFLQSTSFGYSRSMSRWQGGQSDGDNRRHRDDRPFLGRAQRQKVRLSRHRILESAIKVMELYGQSSSILEVEYFEEVGTGLGPTLEFYSTVSKEFSKRKTKLWRENESFDGGDYAFGRRGLFPAPMSEEMSQNENGQKVLHLFKMLGKFVARSMLDSRIIDISFNPTFFRIGDDKTTVTPSLGAVAAVDSDLAKSLKMLKKFLGAKQRIEDDRRLSDAQKSAKLAEIRINDARVEDLSLDFTLPGYPHIDLVPNGSGTSVSLDNLGDYIKAVIDFTLGTGVQRQVDAFRAGFSQVFPYSALRAFTPDELVMLFGRVDEDWSLETLMDSIKADHGYNLDSRSVRNLLQFMSELSPQTKRDFLQFITGSPKLPIGGFKALTPMFTVVCKPSEAPFTSDDYLPSVMTCVNYLKMPDYSTFDIMKLKLGMAIQEGQGAFHLS